MSSSNLNDVVLTGRLTSDPDLDLDLADQDAIAMAAAEG
jgi:hypothetical protein